MAILIVRIGTTDYKYAEPPVPDGWVEQLTPLVFDSGGALDMVWDGALQQLRPKNEAERKADAAMIKREDIYREQEIRSITVMGEEVSRHQFAKDEELYLKILPNKNAIDEVETPIWWGLKQLRDNRNTLLNGLQAWIDDPLKTAADILAFDVAGWSGWTIERP